MKKILFLLTFALAFVVSAGAQTTFPLIAGDTLTNAATVNKVINVTAGYSSMSIMPKLTKLSGTIAGKIVVQGSLDGVYYTGIDSLTLADVTLNHKSFQITAPAHRYYRVASTTTGTSTAQIRVIYVFRRYD